MLFYWCNLCGLYFKIWLYGCVILFILTKHTLHLGCICLLPFHYCRFSIYNICICISMLYNSTSDTCYRWTIFEQTHIIVLFPFGFFYLKNPTKIGYNIFNSAFKHILWLRLHPLIFSYYSLSVLWTSFISIFAFMLQFNLHCTCGSYFLNSLLLENRYCERHKPIKIQVFCLRR